MCTTLKKFLVIFIVFTRKLEQFEIYGRNDDKNNKICQLRLKCTIWDGVKYYKYAKNIYNGILNCLCFPVKIIKN